MDADNCTRNAGIENTADKINAAQCKYFVSRKKRFCRMTVKAGHEYCGEHHPSESQKDINGEHYNVDSNLSGKKNPARIPCPLDNKHTCFVNKLSKHLKVCNAKQDNLPDYILKGVNIGDTCNSSEDISMKHLSDVNNDELEFLIKRINEVYEVHGKDKIKEQILNHSILTDELSRTDYGPNTRKHLIQTSSLLAHLELGNLKLSDTCYVEFGAGKGQLSYWISLATNELPNTSVLLVDRASHRHKYDNKLGTAADRVNRIRADIADLVLEKVDVIKNKNIVALTKHLCGSATDLALRCLINCQQKTKNVKGLLMAFCCHHRCTWQSYTGKQFLLENSFTESDFNVMCGIVSWATCGTGFSRERRKNTESVDFNVQRKTRLNLTREECAEIGRRCKLILDRGRLEYLNANNFDCSLFYYVTKDVSPENVCIVARSK